MKNFTQMKFGEYSFMHNPEELSVESTLDGIKRVYPFSDSVFTPICLDNATVRGRGIITGDDCFLKLLQLQQCLDGRGRLLSISPFPSVNAALTSLKYTLSPSEKLINISFEFTCLSSTKSFNRDDGACRPKSVVAAPRDSLWDIGYKYGVAVEELLRLNTFVKRPDELSEGWVIRLC